MNTINISGIAYNVIGSKSMGNGRTELTLKRPAGRRVYFAVVYENGAISEAV
jgi:hypothetical protein